MLQIIADFQIITPKTGKVFDNHDLNLPIPDQVDHPLKVRTLKVGSRKSIIAKLHLWQTFKVRIQCNIPLNQLTLSGDTVALVLCPVCSFIHILQRKSEIHCDVFFILRNLLSEHFDCIQDRLKAVHMLESDI